MEDTDGSTVTGNFFNTDPTGAGNHAGSAVAAIQIDDNPTAATGNTIGGTTPASENVISNVPGSAIAVRHGDNDDNTFGRNRGTNNDDIFIDLGQDGPGNNNVDAPNHSIDAPLVSSATDDVVAGSGAAANAAVLVFRTPDGGNPNNLTSFLGEATASAAGAWQLPVNIPNGTRVTALQTDTSGDSSELSSLRRRRRRPARDHDHQRTQEAQPPEARHEAQAGEAVLHVQRAGRGRLPVPDRQPGLRALRLALRAQAQARQAHLPGPRLRRRRATPTRRSAVRTFRIVAPAPAAEPRRPLPLLASLGYEWGVGRNHPPPWPIAAFDPCSKPPMRTLASPRWRASSPPATATLDAYASSALRPYLLAALLTAPELRPGSARRSWSPPTIAPPATWPPTWPPSWRPATARYYPSRGVGYLSHLTPPPHLAGLRIAALTELAGERGRPVVVASAVALAEAVPDPELLARGLRAHRGRERRSRRRCRAAGGRRLRAGRAGRGARPVRGPRRHPRRLSGHRGAGGPRRAVRRRGRVDPLVLGLHPALARRLRAGRAGTRGGARVRASRSRRALGRGARGPAATSASSCRSIASAPRSSWSPTMP